MDEAGKHYFRAVIWYYLVNDAKKALEEIYLALEYRDHPGAMALARKIGDRPLTAAPVPQDDILELLSFLELEDRHRFLADFLSREEIDDFAMQQIFWDDWLEVLATGKGEVERIWFLILRHNHESAMALWERCQDHYGNVVAYFQAGYLLLLDKKFEQAEPYLKALLPFGGVYRIAGVRFLMRLPQRSSHSISNISGLFHDVSTEHLFTIAKILQKSQDEKCFARALHLLEKRALSAGEYLQLGRIYADEGDMKGAADCLRHAYRKDPDDPDLLLAELHSNMFLHEKPMARFLKWLVRRANGATLSRIAEITQRRVPEIALAAFDKLEKKGPTGQAKLGRAAAYWYGGNFARADSIIAEVAEGHPELRAETMAWQARSLLRQGESAKARQSLQEILERSPGHALATEVMREFSDLCPVCRGSTAPPVCPGCGYRTMRIFDWQQGKLRWNAENLYFPTAVVLFTTDSQCYSSEQPVHLVIFSTSAQDVRVLFTTRQNVVRKKRFGVTPGLIVLREESFAPGLYEAVLEPAIGTANRHFFLVGSPDATLQLVIRYLKWHSENTLEICLGIRDFLGFPVSGKVALRSLSPFSAWHNFQQVESSDGIAHCTWQLAQCRDFLVITATSEDGREGTTIASPYNFLEQGKIEDVLTQYQREINHNLPVRLEQLAGDKAVVRMDRQEEEVVIALQPIGDSPVAIHRFAGVPPGQAVSWSSTTGITGFYLGTGDGFCRQIEMCGLLLGPCLEVSMAAENRVSPGEKFAVTVTANKRAKGILLSSPRTDFYHPLYAHFLRKMSEILSATKAETGFLESAGPDYSIFGEDDSALDLYLFTAHPTAEISVKAKNRRGKQQLVCIASDGKFFAEQSLEVEVYSPSYLEADFPPAVGMGDCVEERVRYYSEKPSAVRISSAVRGPLADRMVEGAGEITVNVNAPDTIEVRLGPLDKEYRIGALEMCPVVKSSIHYLAAQDYWLPKKVTVYANGAALAEDIAKSLFKDPHRDTETVSAQLYCAGRLYQLSVKADRAGNVWEQEILRLEEVLSSLAADFPQARWGYFPGFAPDREITAEVAHHLSPFLEMPRFACVHELAQKTIQAALSWKISSNRLFPLSLMFKEPGLKTPEAAAGALQHDFNARKALKVLNRMDQDRNHPHWHGTSLGGDEETTALVARAYSEHKYPLKPVLSYFKDRLQNGVLSNPAATAAFFDLLLSMERSAAKIIGDKGTISLEGKSEIKTSFGVTAGELWCREDHPSIENLPERFTPASLKISWQGPSVVRVGSEFRLQLSTTAVKYPHLQILVPPNIKVCRGKETFEGHTIWPHPGKAVQLDCKAIRSGMAHFYFLLEERYDQRRCFARRYPIVVV